MDAVLLGLLGGIAGKSAARLGGQALADRTMDLLGMQRAEMKLLNSLQGRVDRILSAPYRTAIRHVEAAAADWRSDEDRTWLLRKALEKLTEAVELDDDTLRRSLACAQLAAVWSVLGNSNDVLRDLREARTLAIAAAREMTGAKKSPNKLVEELVDSAFPFKPLPTKCLVEIEVANLYLRRYGATKAARSAEASLRLVHKYADTLRDALERLGDTEGDHDHYKVRLRERYASLYDGPLTPGILALPPLGHLHVAAVDLSYERSGDERDWENRRSIGSTVTGWKFEKRRKRSFRRWIFGDFNILPGPKRLRRTLLFRSRRPYFRRRQK